MAHSQPQYYSATLLWRVPLISTASTGGYSPNIYALLDVAVHETKSCLTFTLFHYVPPIFDSSLPSIAQKNTSTELLLPQKLNSISIQRLNVKMFPTTTSQQKLQIIHLSANIDTVLATIVLSSPSTRMKCDSARPKFHQQALDFIMVME